MLGCLILGVLIVTNQSSIVTRGPANANASLNEAWTVARDTAASPDQLAAAEAKARRTLKREPLNSVAMSLIGAIRERQGKPAETEALMNAAVSINHRENIADLWLFDHLLAQKRYDPAFLRADALLRREADFTAQLFPRLVDSLSDPAAIDPLARRLAKAPSWRNIFTRSILDTYADPGPPFALLSAIKRAGGQVTPEELTSLLNRLVANKRYEEAYLDWILFLPDNMTSKIAYVYDGDFAGLPDSKPFGWNFADGASGVVENPPDRGDPALHIIYDGVANRTFPSQLLVIPPGHYVLDGQVMSGTTASAGRMEWVVTCEGQQQALADTVAPVATLGQWTRFSVGFTITPACPAQRLTLRAIHAQQSADIDLWYDKVNILPAGSAP